jgi:HK97 family phage prohead protease
MNTFKIFAPMLKASMGTDGKMRLHGIASSTVKDRHGDTMNPSALVDMERSANNNLTIFLNHEYKVPEDVAGHVERAFVRSHPQDPDIHDLSLDIVINDKNERAVKAWEAIDGGTQLGLSIGAMIPDGGAERDRKTGSYSINHVDLLETSLVGVPANPRSWVEYAVKSLNGGTFLEENEEFDESESEVADAVMAEKEIDSDTVETFDAETEFEGTGEEMVGIEASADGTEVELVVEEELEGAEIGEVLNAVTTTTYTTNTGNYTINPDITDATVNIKTPYADVSIDTGNRGGKPAASDGSSQEALQSAPETEDEDEAVTPNPWAAIGLSSGPTETKEVESALQLLEPTVVASLQNSSELLKAITRELIDTRKSLDEAVAERDQAIAMTEKVLSNTAEILARLSKTPAGRRAVVREASEKFAGLEAVYGEEFLTLLKKG